MQDRKATQEGSVSPCPCEHTLFLHSSSEAPLIQCFFRDPDCEVGDITPSFCIIISAAHDRSSSQGLETDASLFSLFPVMMRKQSSFDSHFLSTFFHPGYNLFPLRRATLHVYYPGRWCPSPAHSFLRSVCVCEPGRLMWNSVKPLV